MGNDLVDTLPNETGINRWHALQIFNGYRICLALILLFLHAASLSGIGISIGSTTPISVFAILYGVLGLILLILAHRRTFEFEGFVLTSSLIDIILLVVLIQLSHQMIALAMLINIVIAGSGIVMPGRISLFFAACATVLLLFQQIIFEYLVSFSGVVIVQASFFGMSFFATAMLAHLLAVQLKLTQGLIARHHSSIANLERLNSLIVQNINAGIIVSDLQLKIQIINQTACRLFKFQNELEPTQVSVLSEELAELLTRWRYDPLKRCRPFRYVMKRPNVIINLMPLGEQGGHDILIMIEDASEMAQQAQEMKLASLGRFTASIAHELRNPLGAISHAAQLMQESNSAKPDDKRLYEIVVAQSERMNGVINNILQLSQRKKSIPETIELKCWLDDFIEAYQARNNESIQIECDINPTTLHVNMDRSQLEQVMTNLVENGLFYSLAKTNNAYLGLSASVNLETAEPYLDIIDQGPGISDQESEHIFEPFYTSKRTGTGLGLYIAKELCEANQASLEYIPAHDGACFRITFHNGTSNRITQ